jgi:hypothetical protein
MVLGILLGLILPAISYLFLYVLDLSVYAIFDAHIVDKMDYLLLLSITVNLFPVRYYFVNLKYDKTGRGVLLVTLILTLSYFLIIGIN